MSIPRRIRIRPPYTHLQVFCGKIIFVFLQIAIGNITKALYHANISIRSSRMTRLQLSELHSVSMPQGVLAFFVFTSCGRTPSADNQIRATGLEKMLKVTPRGHKFFVPKDAQTDIEIERMQQFIIQHRHEFQSGERTYPLHMHGLRHTYAQEQYLSLVASGHTEFVAELQVSKLLGHTRPDVTRIYLAGAQEE